MAGANASNIIPHEASLGGTVRTFEKEDRDRLERRIREVAEGVAKCMGATAEVIYERGYPTTRNHPDQTRFAAEVATAVAGAGDPEPAVVLGPGGEHLPTRCGCDVEAAVIIGVETYDR